MDRLWATWRSQYIESIQEPAGEECVFCTAAKQSPSETESLLVDKGSYTFTVLNLYPYNNGHVMVVPFRHTADILSLAPEESAEVFAQIQKVVSALRLAAKPDGFNIGANLGKVSGAGIADHLHFHVVPRWNGDTNFMPVIGEVKVLSQDLLVTKQKLIEAFAQSSVRSNHR